MDVVKIQVRRSGSGTESAFVGIPKTVASELKEAGVDAFSLEVTDEGLLLRPLEGGAPDAAERPAWLRPKIVVPQPAAESRNGSSAKTPA